MSDPANYGLAKGLAAGALDPGDVDPGRLLTAALDVLAVALDAGGPEGLAEAFATQTHPEKRTEMLDLLWRAEHPRTADLLEAIGQHHPDKAVAKAARKSLLRHRSPHRSRTAN